MRAPRLSALLITAAFAGVAMAKLPPPTPEAAAKAAEAKDKAAWTSKVAAYQLCKAQDAAVARYRADASKAGRDAKQGTAGAACTDPGPYAAKPAPAAAAPAPAAADKKS